MARLITATVKAEALGSNPFSVDEIAEALERGLREMTAHGSPRVREVTSTLDFRVDTVTEEEIG